MYCGDEVNAIVGDFGACESKFGFAGEDTPKLVTPSTLYTSGGSVVSVPVAGLAVQSLYEQEEVNWTSVERLWESAFAELRVSDPTVHPIFVSSSSCGSSDKYMELMLEKFQSPCFFSARDAVLSAFTFGRSTALVVDFGASSTRIVPIYDGYALHQPSRIHPIGQKAICNELETQLLREGAKTRVTSNNLLPKFTNVDIQNLTPSYLSYRKSAILEDIKNSICFVSPVPLQNNATLMSANEDQHAYEQYELPDGTIIERTLKECASVSEILFSSDNSSKESNGLVDSVVECLENCDVDIRRELCSNIILCGGGTKLKGLTERFNSDLQAKLPMNTQMVKVKLVQGMKVEHLYSVFIGGSILASLGSFQQMWISRKEYDEIGPSQLAKTRLARFC